MDRGCADAGRGRVDKNALAHVKAGPREERVVRGDKNFRHRARLHPVHLGRNASEIALRHDHKLCLRTTARDSKNAIADLPIANGVTNRFDFACELHTRDVVRITRRCWVMSAPLQNIGAVQSSRIHSYAHAICSRRRRSVHLQHTDSVDPTMRCDDDGTHPWIFVAGLDPDKRLTCSQIEQLQRTALASFFVDRQVIIPRRTKGIEHACR